MLSIRDFGFHFYFESNSTSIPQQRASLDSWMPLINFGLASEVDFYFIIILFLVSLPLFFCSFSLQTN